MKFRLAICALFFSAALFQIFPEETSRAFQFAQQVRGPAPVEWKTVFSSDLAALLSDSRISDYAMKVAAELLKSREFPEDPTVAAAAAFYLLSGTEDALRRGTGIAETKMTAAAEWQTILALVARIISEQAEDDKNNAGGNENGRAYGLGKNRGLGALISSLAHAKKDNQVVILNRGQLKKTLDEKIKKDITVAK